MARTVRTTTDSLVLAGRRTQAFEAAATDIIFSIPIDLPVLSYHFDFVWQTIRHTEHVTRSENGEHCLAMALVSWPWSLGSRKAGNHDSGSPDVPIIG
ncbi:hypothetical protein N7456_008158 [Penicillium angulare]|uniref:Uncharacterized protein n=1 Tax=Penicillium angulare TaxID=116970 RepID=A0A9W9FC43_9EURO|nr:hypothetical protein N7456_008158 [Penicillium angulare]